MNYPATTQAVRVGDIVRGVPDSIQGTQEVYEVIGQVYEINEDKQYVSILPAYLTATSPAGTTVVAAREGSSDTIELAALSRIVGVGPQQV